MDAKIKQALSLIKHGTEEVLSEDELIKKLSSGKPLIVKAGFDPTAPNIHLGHTVLIRKLQTFQQLGHRVVFLIGDFTATIGDPSGRSKIRKKTLSPQEIQQNTATYTKQVFKILDKDKTDVMFNSQWTHTMSFADSLNLASKTTVARLLERDDFQKRLADGLPLTLMEVFYPLIQALDSVQLKADVELGGTDQKFNLLMGRTLQKEYHLAPQVVITMPIIAGLDGKQKMSKSLDNYIAIEDTPIDMFGKLMSIPDALIIPYFEALTNLPLNALQQHKLAMAAGENPKHSKVDLAKEIVATYHSTAAALNAAAEFENIFAHKQLPSNMPTLNINETTLWIVELAERTGTFKSKSEIRRLIKGGGLKIDDQPITDDNYQLNVQNNSVLRIGKKKFYRIKC